MDQITGLSEIPTVLKFKAAEAKYAPQGDVLKARILETTPGLGRKVTLPHRHGSVVSTGVSVEMPEGYHLRVALHPSLASKGVGMLSRTWFRGGNLEVVVYNCGQQTIVIEDGVPLVEVSLGRSYEFTWEAQNEQG